MKKSVLFASILLCSFFFFTHCSTKSADQQLLEAMEREAATVNAQCPVVDGSLILDSCSISSDKSFNYHYTMTDTSIASDTAKIASENKKIMLGVINNNPAMIEYKRLGVSFVYRFGDKAGNNVYSFRITPEDYQ